MPATPPPARIAEPLPGDLDPVLAKTIRLRFGYGLRFDLEYVRLVADDPRAANLDYNVPLYPEEAEDIRVRFAESQALIEVILRYAATHTFHVAGNEYGGVYIDESTRAGMITMWTDHLPEHAAAIREIAGPDARLAFRQVRYTEEELQIAHDRIRPDLRGTWLMEIPADVQGFGVRTIENTVVVKVSSANPDAAAIIEAHFGLGGRLRVESDGTGVSFIPWGTVKIQLEPIAGLSPSSLVIGSESDDPGTCGWGAVSRAFDTRGRIDYPCQAGTRTIIILGPGKGGGRREIGRGTVVIGADAVVRLTIQVNVAQ